MERKDIKDVLHKVNSGTASVEEEQMARYWLHYFQIKNLKALSEKELTEESDTILNALLSQPENKPAVIKTLWSRIAVAASVLLCLAIGGYFYLKTKPKAELVAIKPNTFKNDVQPGGNNAILTLGNGQQILLKTAQNGLIAKQSKTVIQKTADGKIKYDADASDATVLYNTVTTKRSNKYDLTLPDGTKVYLDAESSIRFPTSFNSNERLVSVTGQAYFEVAHDKTKPFRVKVKDEVVEVLGTHFNINAYEDESVMKTTLLQGSVKIIISGKETLLVPGQQAQIQEGMPVSVSDRIDLDEVMAWRNGLFKFNNADLTTVMQQLNRWYDVDIEYQGAEKVYHFGGYMSRDATLKSVLRLLELNGVKFSIDGRKLIVYR